MIFNNFFLINRYLILSLQNIALEIDRSRFDEFDFREGMFFFTAWLRHVSLLPAFGCDLFWAWRVAKVNGVEKCVLKARPSSERERKKQGGVCDEDSSPIHHGCFISDVAI